MTVQDLPPRKGPIKRYDIEPNKVVSKDIVGWSISEVVTGIVVGIDFFCFFFFFSKGIIKICNIIVNLIVKLFIWISLNKV